MNIKNTFAVATKAAIVGALLFGSAAMANGKCDDVCKKEIERIEKYDKPVREDPLGNELVEKIVKLLLF